MIYTYIMSHLFFRGVGRDNKSALTSALTHLYYTVHIHQLLCFSSGPDSSELHCMVLHLNHTSHIHSVAALHESSIMHTLY